MLNIYYGVYGLQLASNSSIIVVAINIRSMWGGAGTGGVRFVMFDFYGSVIYLIRLHSLFLQTVFLYYLFIHLTII